MLKRVNENYNVTMTDVEEYRRNKPLIEILKAKKLELEKAKKRIFDLEGELYKMQCEWSASNYELDLVNIELKPHVESEELYNLHPSKYADAVCQNCLSQKIIATTTIPDKMLVSTTAAVLNNT
jgi:hypothetical protein